MYQLIFTMTIIGMALIAIRYYKIGWASLGTALILAYGLIPAI